jgi:hypothetical protein
LLFKLLLLCGWHSVLRQLRKPRLLAGIDQQRSQRCGAAFAAINRLLLLLLLLLLLVGCRIEQ